MGGHSPTPTPWRAFQLMIAGPGGTMPIAHCTTGVCFGSSGTVSIRSEEAEANARLIAQAVNCHAEMVEALAMADRLLEQFAGSGWPDWGEAAVIRSALAKASPTPRKVPDPTGSER